MVSLNAWKHRLYIALLLGAASLHAAVAAPVLSATATPVPAILGATVGLDVSITDITDLYGYQFTLLFDPALLQASVGTEGVFLATGGSTYFGAGTNDNVAGSISGVFDTLIGSVPGVSGSGVLAHFDFSVIGVGRNLFSFSDVQFLNSAFADLAPQAASVALQTVSVPEPSVYYLLGIGLAGLTVLRRRKFH